jgi:hypothetical protein
MVLEKTCAICEIRVPEALDEKHQKPSTSPDGEEVAGSVLAAKVAEDLDQLAIKAPIFEGSYHDIGRLGV